MTPPTPTFSRRDTLLTALSLGVGCGAASLVTSPACAAVPDDFAFLTGSWRVRHHKLKSRLLGETQWWDFNGTCHAWPLLGGEANVDDNVLSAPNGTYRGVTLRRRHPETKEWSIWWLDEHGSGIEPPVTGAFKNGIGTFFGDDQLRGRPIRVRFVWSEITAKSARWEQAFSPDDGLTWEVNWVMHFERDA